jgi:THO complex subunit 1
MLEDLLELSTIEEAEPMFNYVESKAATWEEWAGCGAWSGQGPAKLSMLRFCNQLLKRSSRSQSAELCGRILIFCTRWFPLNDRSGLNPQGVINTGHRTVVEEVEEVRTPLDLGVDFAQSLRLET